MSTRLTIELVPRTSWGRNLRSHLTRSEWLRLSRAVADRSGGRCEVCGLAGRLHCHEV